MIRASTKRKAPINRGLSRDYDIQKDSELNTISSLEAN